MPNQKRRVGRPTKRNTLRGRPKKTQADVPQVEEEVIHVAERDDPWYLIQCIINEPRNKEEEEFPPWRIVRQASREGKETRDSNEEGLPTFYFIDNVKV